MLGFQPIADEPISSVANAVTSGVSGSVAYTNNNDTLAASGTTTIVGTLATTNANDTSAASGTTTIVGTSSTTNANDTLSASGSVGGGVTGTLAYTNNNDSISASGWAGTITGTLATTNADDTLTASGTVPQAASSKVGGDDVPRYEIWERRKKRPQKDAELKTAIQEAMDKAMGRVRTPSIAAMAPVVQAAPKIAPAGLVEALRDNEDEDEEALLMLL